MSDSRELFSGAINDDLALITSSNSKLCKEVKSRSQVKSSEQNTPSHNTLHPVEGKLLFEHKHSPVVVSDDR